MTTKYRIMPFVFDMTAFAGELEKVDRAFHEELCEIMIIDQSTLRNWITGQYDKSKFPHPSMSNFLKVCNWLDLDPREFFKLEVAE